MSEVQARIMTFPHSSARKYITGVTGNLHHIFMYINPCGAYGWICIHINILINIFKDVQYFESEYPRKGASHNTTFLCRQNHNFSHGMFTLTLIKWARKQKRYNVLYDETREIIGADKTYWCLIWLSSFLSKAGLGSFFQLLIALIRLCSSRNPNTFCSLFKHKQQLRSSHSGKLTIRLGEKCISTQYTWHKHQICIIPLADVTVRTYNLIFALLDHIKTIICYQISVKRMTKPSSNVSLVSYRNYIM